MHNGKFIMAKFPNDSEFYYSRVLTERNKLEENEKMVRINFHFWMQCVVNLCAPTGIDKKKGFILKAKSLFKCKLCETIQLT